MAEILIRQPRTRVGDRQDDFSTLREESTGLVSKKTLQRRHPDMIWSADTVNGDRVLFLLEFQRTVDRLMALRTTTYSALALEGIAAGLRTTGLEIPLPEFVSCLVLYHGDGTRGLRRSMLASCSCAPIWVATAWSHGERLRGR